MSALENYNYARDCRTQGAVTRPVLYLDDGTDFELPMKWGVCHVCNGEGKHVNPSIDAGGLHPADMDMDFLADYMGGVYDVTCNGCNGRTTIPVVDWDALTTEQREQYEAQLQELADCEAERLAEIRMGA